MGYSKKSFKDDKRRRLGILGKRVGFDKNGGVICEGCFTLRNENAILKEQIVGLKAALKYSQTPGKKIVDGAHTPSSKLSHKKNTWKENEDKKGGAKKGHKGHGRKSCALEDSDEVIKISAPQSCDSCQCNLLGKDHRERTVIDSMPVLSRRVVYLLERAVCPKCRKQFRAKAPVLPKNLYGNSLLSQAATMHYQHGVPLGRVINLLGPNVTLGGLIQGFHRLGKLAEEVRPLLIEAFRRSTVRHADETGWRNDGRSGYVWLFSTPRISLFEFKASRASSVPKEIFGDSPLGGVLIVDRYSAYNRLPVHLQYCYAHLLREVEKTSEEFPEEIGLVNFCECLAACLAQAMKLRRQPLSDAKYYRKAKALKAEIKALVDEQQPHLAVRHIQSIFRDPKNRLFHWVNNRNIPPENNRAERELRPSVIARKVSFGSQSDAGAKTRGSLMTLLHTVAKRAGPQAVQPWLKESLDQLVRNPSVKLADLLPP